MIGALMMVVTCFVERIELGGEEGIENEGTIRSETGSDGDNGVIVNGSKTT